MCDIIHHRNNILCSFQGKAVVVLTKASRVCKYYTCKGVDSGPMSILSCNDTVEGDIVSKMSTTRRMCEILYVLIVVDDCIVSIMRHYIRMEKIDFSEDGW